VASRAATYDYLPGSPAAKAAVAGRR